MMHMSPSRILIMSNIGCRLSRKLHCNPIMCIDIKWREENKLPINPNSFGPLTNLPDYSFSDGRVVPYSTRQKNRIDKQRELLIKMKQMISEIDFAVVRHEQLKLKAEQEKQKIISAKLKKKNIKFLDLPPKVLNVNSVITNNESKEAKEN
ncbi:PREDICTED: 39S ribosomal protein L52, mitochondrial [Ceratosolen solmsi marchali]|uniref:Large ribosomal subunit protein mL52 n=1 Tax=Ceratosolen solmsi marchali TaxID=326594 RepID=A0AAJ7DYU9_9HYME|nr:PREDICTED: 39S ribosomal protein L52, mitochondrial [Ceratosolen solmsi marchali]